METIRIEDKLIQHIVYINTSQVMGTVKYKYKTSKVKKKNNNDKRAHPIIAIRYSTCFFSSVS